MAKKIFFILILLVFVFGISILLDQDQVPMLEDSNSGDHFLEMKVADFSFNDLDGKSYKISDFKGKIIFLNFWASWCQPCQEEFPLILEKLKKFRDRAIFMAISNDEKKIDIIKFIDRYREEISGMKANIFLSHDPNKKISFDKFNVLRLPETFIVNKQGVIIKKIIGVSQWRDKTLDSIIKRESD